MPSEICLVCPNDISREGLSHILESEDFHVINSFENIDEISDTSSLSDALFIIDCISPEEQPRAVEVILSHAPSSRVVVLSETFDMKTMIECFNAGAQGYIIRTMKSPRLLAALRLAALGEKVVPSDFIDVLGSHPIEYSMPSSVENEIHDANLSPREMDVLCCLMAGYSNKVIARQLDVCEATVKVHVKSILRKLNVHNRTQAAIWANSRGISDANCVSSSTH